MKMNVFEKQIQEFAGKAKGIQESPDTTVLRSDKLSYELHKERMEAHLDAWQQGKPSVEGVTQLTRFFRSMELLPFGFSGTVDNATGYDAYKSIIERMGFPVKCCERTIIQLAMCEIGDLPKPDIVLSDGVGCDPDKYNRTSLANWNNIPHFYIDVPLNPEDKPDLSFLNYVTGQLGEFIEWAEKKVPGVKYDEAKHIEILEMDTVAEKYRREIYQLRKHVPCPITPLDSLRRRNIHFEPSRYPNMQKANEYLRVCRDELGERVASGKGPYPEERLRLLWAGQSHDEQVLNPHKLLMERKVALPLVMTGSTSRMLGRRCAPYGEMSEYGVKLSPLQEEARLMNVSNWGGPGKRWVNATLDFARDIGAHGIIHWLQVGCTPMRSMGSVVAEKAEKELGIPVLNIEGTQMDQDCMSQGQFDEILSAFIDKCFDWAGKPRQ